jgi:3-hydroxybutyrate dehydrogenase
MMDRRVVTNRRILVTGGASGIGKEISKTFLENEARVAVLDRVVTPEVEQELESFPRKSFSLHQGDVTDEGFVEDVVKRIADTWGPVDVLVNNAGIVYRALAEDMDVGRWRQVIDVNLTGPMICAKKVIPFMKRQRWGRIINLSSMWGLIGADTCSAYAAAKAGLVQLTKVWAIELARYEITVNAICPSWVETPMVETFVDRMAEAHGTNREDAMKWILSHVSQGRLISPSEIASLALFLASDVARGINGAAIPVDTGITAGMPAGLHQKLE